MRALVTGGLGYIGHAVTHEFLGAGWEVTALSRDRLEGSVPVPEGTVVVQGDLTDRRRLTEIMTGAEFDAVVHLGGLAQARESWNEPLNYFDVNVGGTANLLHAIDDLPEGHRRPRLVYGSTTLVYGSRYVGAVDENTEPSPESPYADTKVAVERLISAHAITSGLAATILRIFNVGGGVEGVCDTDPTRLIPNLMRVAASETRSITLMGNGTALRDFVHVADVARAIRLAVEAARGGACPVYNIGSGTGTRIIDVVRHVEEIVGHDFEIVHTPQEGAPGRLIADIGYAAAQLGWAPQRSDIATIVADAWKYWPGR
jgi:UDP-glucose 4-epimerase